MKKIKVTLLFLTILMSLTILFVSCDESTSSSPSSSSTTPEESTQTTPEESTQITPQKPTQTTPQKPTQTTPKECAHTYVSKLTTKPTCTANGVKVFTCQKCKDTYNETVMATGHTIVTDKAVAATCVKTGLTEGSHCSICNEIIKKQSTISTKSHVYEYNYTKGAVSCSLGCTNTKTIYSLGTNLYLNEGMISTKNSYQIITYLGERYVKVNSYLDYTYTRLWSYLKLYDSKGNTSGTTAFTSGETTSYNIISATVSEMNGQDNYIYIPYTGAGKYAIAHDSLYGDPAVIEFYVN